MADHTAAESILDRWRETEPVRLAAYPFLAVLVGIAVTFGLVTGEQSVAILGGLALVCGVAGTEIGRAGAYSPVSVAARVDAEVAPWEASIAGWRQYAEELQAEHPHPATVAAIPAQRAQCREVDDGVRCALVLDHEGPHRMT